MLDEILSLIIFKHIHEMLLSLIKCYQSVNVWTLSDKVQVTGVRPFVKRSGSGESRQPLMAVDLSQTLTIS